MAKPDDYFDTSMTKSDDGNFTYRTGKTGKIRENENPKALYTLDRGNVFQQAKCASTIVTRNRRL